MSVKAKLEAIIYATEEPVTLNQLASLLKEPALAEIRAQEEARLALNETVSAGPAPPEEDEFDDDFEPIDEIEPSGVKAEPSPRAEAAAETAAEVSLAPPPEAAPAEPEPTKGQVAEGEKEELRRVKSYLSELLDQLTAEYAASDRGMEIRQVAGGYRMGTKPEHHDVVVGFAKSLKPPVRLSLQALETLAVIAYKQPVTVPEISEIRGVDSAGVIATLLDRKLVTTAGRKQVIGRPILYKSTKEFLMRFGLNDLAELPSVEEFEKLGDPQAELFTAGPTAPAAEAAGEAVGGHSEEAAQADPPDPGAPDTEALRELANPENSQAGTRPAEAPAADENQPERFNEAVAPVAGIDTPDENR